MKYLSLIIILCFSSVSLAEVAPVLISPKYCKDGAKKQPNGQFAIYVFCDDALGTNIAVYLYDLGNPFRGKYKLGKRFWQGEAWSYDVTSYVWLKDNKYLLIATSAIYGSGSLYLLNLEEQTSKVIYQDSSAILEITNVNGKSVTLRYETKHGNYEHKIVQINI